MNKYDEYDFDDLYATLRQIWLENGGGDGTESMSIPEKTIELLEFLKGQITNGGMVQFLTGPAAENSDDTLEALDRAAVAGRRSP